MLCYAAQCCVMLCIYDVMLCNICHEYVMQCYAMLLYVRLAMLCYIMLYCVVHVMTRVKTL